MDRMRTTTRRTLRRTGLRSLLGASLLCVGVAFPAAAEPLEILITPREPYYVVSDTGAVSGTVARRAVAAFARANIDINWTVVSFNRQLQLIEDNARPLCGLGWFKNPEREAFAKFSDPIYQEMTLVVLARSDNAAVTIKPGLRTLLADPSLTIGKKLGFSYGAAVDELIAERRPPSITTDQDTIGMVRMLIGKRFDYMIAAPAEASHVIATLGADGGILTVIRLNDLPPQNRRYMMCSRSVSDDLIARLNAGIQQLDP